MKEVTTQLAVSVARTASRLLERGAHGVSAQCRTLANELTGAASRIKAADLIWPSIYITSLAFYGNLILAADSTGDASGLGPAQEVSDMVSKSPTLAKNLRDLEADGWKIVWGSAGTGYYTSRAKKTISIDIRAKESPISIFTYLAHETGHAYSGGIEHKIASPRKNDTREQWIQEQMYNAFRGEGEAELVLAQIRREYAAATGTIIEEKELEQEVRSAVDSSYASYLAGTLSREDARRLIADSIVKYSEGWYPYYRHIYEDLSRKYFDDSIRILT